MTNTTVYFRLFIGDDQNLNVTVLDDDGNIVDITSASAIDWTMSADEFASAVISKSLGSGITITDGPNGVFRVTLDTTDTESLDSGTYYQKSRVTLGGNRTHVAIGTVWLRP